MKRFFSGTLALAGAMCLTNAGCTPTVPRQLVDARQAFMHAVQSNGAAMVPDEIHKARVSLDRAEQEFNKTPEGQTTIDYAYVAERKAQLAEALGGVALAERDKQSAVQGQAAAQAAVTDKVRTDLRTTEQRLTNEQRARQSQAMALQHTRDQLNAEQAAAERDRAALDKANEQVEASEQARRDAEQQARDAMQELARMNAVKEEARGLVITLNGSVLFATAQSVLLPDAQKRLDQVAVALTGRKETIEVEGHTDNRGGDSYNMDLSQRRADSVRAYLITRGISADRCRAMGYGKSRPIADNKSAEGRANNRRVEIVLERMQASR